MALKFNQNTLHKTEQIFGDMGYLLRYEKGNFQSGYCVLENQSVVVINKFLNLENKINALLEIIFKIPINAELLSDEAKKMFQQIEKMNKSNIITTEKLLF